MVSLWLIARALERLNWIHGYGDIVAVDRIASTFTVRGYGMKPETFDFMFLNASNMVQAFGHSISIHEKEAS